jgi:hypothetical protein
VGGQRKHKSIRDETREAAAELMPMITKLIKKVASNRYMFREHAEELIGMHQNNIYLIQLSKMEEANSGSGGGVREAQAPVLRLVARGGR